MKEVSVCDKIVGFPRKTQQNRLQNTELARDEVGWTGRDAISSHLQYLPPTLDQGEREE